jgi:hypothetical protein
MAVGAGGVMLTSADGQTWAELELVTTDDLEDVTFANGQFVTIARAILMCRTPADSQPVSMPFIAYQPPLLWSMPAWSNAVISANAIGWPQMSYQWFKESAPLPGQTNAQLQLGNLRRSDTGRYSVLVSNALGMTVGSNVFLRVAVPQRFESTLRLPDGRIQLTFGDQDGGLLSDVDLSYMAYWATTNLFNANAWVRITNGITLRNGKVEVTDVESLNHSRRFYLVMEYPVAEAFRYSPGSVDPFTSTNSNPNTGGNGN